MLVAVLIMYYLNLLIMNTRVKVLGVLIIAFILFIGCEKRQYSGSIIVKMTDAPAEFSEVNVEVKQVLVHYKSGNEGWVSLETNEGIYNLLELQNGVTTVIANKNDLLVGTINQMRLILGTNNTVVLDSSVFKLNMSSQYETGIKLNVNTEINADNDAEILIDFDAEKSIVVEGNGSFKLKPVITVIK